MGKPAVVDVDRHVDPPAMGALVDYLPEHYAEQVLHSRWTLDRYAAHWYPGIARRPPDSAAPATVALPGGVEAAIDASVVTCLSGIEGVRDPYLSAALATALNDWMDAEVLSGGNDAYGSVCVSLTNPDAAVREIDRRGDGRFVRVLFPVRSDTPFGNVRYHKVLEACERNGLAVALHAWGSSPNPPTPSGAVDNYVEDYLANSQIAEAQIASLICEGAFELFPQLRVSVLECGFAWLAGFLWRLEKDWKGLWREIPWVRSEPSAVVQEHFRFSTAPAHVPANPQQLRKVLDMVNGADLLMYATDHPHDHGANGLLALAGLKPDEASAIASRNAIEHYRLNRFSSAA